MQVHENQEYQVLILAKEAKRVLSLLHTRDKKNNKQQLKGKFSNHHYHIQDVKYVQHKNINMTWDFWRFPRNPVAEE